MNEASPRILLRDEGVQSLRAIAAFLVLLQHALFFSYEAKSFSFQPPIDLGYIGVGLFFVISGFVITQCLSQRYAFIINRLARIYPPYWIAIAISGASAFIMNQKWSIDSVSFFLTPTVYFNGSYKIPYWTLIYEIIFYLVIYFFILISASKKILKISLVTWAFIIFLTGFERINPGFGSYIGVIAAGPWILLSPINLYFIGGALYALSGFSTTREPSFLLLILALIFYAAGVNFGNTYISLSLHAVSFVIFLDLARTLKHNPLLVKIGDYSYGLYLSHWIFISLAIFLIKKIAPDAPLAIYILSTIALPLSLGLIYGYIEYYIHVNVIKRLTPR